MKENCLFPMQVILKGTDDINNKGKLEYSCPNFDVVGDYLIKSRNINNYSEACVPYT